MGATNGTRPDKYVIILWRGLSDKKSCKNAWKFGAKKDACVPILFFWKGAQNSLSVFMKLSCTHPVDLQSQPLLQGRWNWGCYSTPQYFLKYIGKMLLAFSIPKVFRSKEGTAPKNDISTPNILHYLASLCKANKHHHFRRIKTPILQCISASFKISKNSDDNHVCKC